MGGLGQWKKECTLNFLSSNSLKKLEKLEILHPYSQSNQFKQFKHQWYELLR